MAEIRRAISVAQLLNTKFKVMKFEGKWHEFIGDPEQKGWWIIWGASGNGKTGLLMQLAKYLTNFGRVAFNSLEEGYSESIKKAVVRENMIECDGSFIFLDKEPIEELIMRLKKRKSPDFIFLDSIQYTGLNKITAKELTKEFPKKLFIASSHAYGKLPDGRTANAIRFDANVKIRVEGFMAFAISRYLEKQSEPLNIWNEGIDNYWKSNTNTENENNN